MFKCLLLVICTLVSMGIRAGTERTDELPSIAGAIDEWSKQRRGGGLSAADQAVMADAADSLRRTLPSPGLAVGMHAPDFQLANAQGGKVTLSEALKSGPVVLTFYRGAWCPFCRFELQALEKSQSVFAQYDATVLAITPQRIEQSREQAKAASYSFPILTDEDGRVAKAYNVYFELPDTLNQLYMERFELDVAEYNGAGRLGLPVPATFVIDRSGIIRAAFADTDYKKRMEPSAIVAALKTLGR